MKVNMRTLVGTARVYSIPSSSREGLSHYLMFFKDDVKCTCEGFQYHGDCKHVQTVIDGTSQDGP